MTLPDFLVIGAQRAGTTWLDIMLRSHGEIRMARNRKEVHFFDEHYDKGVDWYRSFFEPADGESAASRVGETTPHYLYDPRVPERVAELLPDCRLVAILRNPIDRAYSQYGHNVKSKGWTIGFEEAIEREPQLLDRGRYMDQLQRFLRLFRRDQLLVCIFEESTSEPGAAARDLGVFLEVDPERFTYSSTPANESYLPRFPRSYAAARSAGRLLRKGGLDVVVESFKRLGVPGVFGSKGGLEPMREETRAKLRSHFAPDRQALEDFLGRRIPLWD